MWKWRSAFRNRGVAAVEFALVCIVFFTVLLSIIDWSYLLWVNLTMQHAVREGARLAVTGRVDVDPNPDPSKRTRYNAAIAQMADQSMGLWSEVSPSVSVKTINSAGVAVALPASNLGSGGDIIVISVDCYVTPLTPFIAAFFASSNGKFHFTVSTTMKNEQFS
jgi:Flp pilus assembly protein TadG